METAMGLEPRAAFRAHAVAFRNLGPTIRTHQGRVRLHGSFISGDTPLAARPRLQPAAPPCRRRRASLPPTRASLNVKDAATGVEFPLVQKFWFGEDCRVLGTAVRTKKVAFIGVKVYAIALYVEAEKAARELGVRARGGFFDNDDDYCSALTDGGFSKALQIELVRDVEGATFVAALNEALRPRMALSGELSVLDEFRTFFESRKLAKGTCITLFYPPEAVLQVVVRPQQEPLDSASPDLSIPSASLCRSLFEVFLGSAAVIPEAKKEWAAGARALLDSDNVRRDTRKGGSG